MSNFLYNGFDFNELNSKFQLKNISSIYVGEIGQMRLPLLNNQNNGYALNNSTLYNTTPDFLLEKQIDTNIITLLKYDGTNDIFKFYKTIDLQNNVRIKNSLNPIEPQDLVTKSFLESSIGGFGDGSVTSVGVSTSTNGLAITGSPITLSGTININLSNQLQNFSSLGMGNVNQVLATGVSNNFVWKNVGTVTSVGLNTPINSGITITNTPIIDSGSIAIDLSSNLKAFNTLGYGLNGQVLTIDNGAYSWVTPLSGGNVTGSSSTSINALALWNNTTGTSLGSTNFTLNVNGNLDLNFKRIVSAQDPVSAQDYTTKNYVDTIPHGLVMFTSSGSWVVPAKVTSFKVTLIGGGAGGGGASAASSSGGGGGAGGVSIKIYSNIASGTVYNFVIGNAGTGGVGGNAGTNGGNSTFSTDLTANGGVGGPFGANSSSTIIRGGLGGTAMGGNINLQGGEGGCVLAQNAYKPSGAGGNSYLGQGGIGVATASGNTVNGISPLDTAYGAGGSGGLKSGTSNANGGNGIGGCTIIEW